MGSEMCIRDRCRVVHVLKWLPVVRPFLGPTLVDKEKYRDQVLLATSAVGALSRGGELRIPALLLPHEYFFLREHLAVQLLNRGRMGGKRRRGVGRKE